MNIYYLLRYILIFFYLQIKQKNKINSNKFRRLCIHGDDDNVVHNGNEAHTFLVVVRNDEVVHSEVHTLVLVVRSTFLFK